MTMALRIRPATTPAMLAIWSDATTIDHALAFETALARAAADEGVLDTFAADAITAACANFVVEAATLADEAAVAGTLAIPLVRRLRAMVPDEAAGAVHRGATSQDLADTVTMLQVRASADLLQVDVARIATALDASAHMYETTPAIGRTLLQDALPIAFGLRVAQVGRQNHRTAVVFRGLNGSVGARIRS